MKNLKANYLVFDNNSKTVLKEGTKKECTTYLEKEIRFNKINGFNNFSLELRKI